MRPVNGRHNDIFGFRLVDHLVKFCSVEDWQPWQPACIDFLIAEFMRV
jgi:hypothetical protein